MQPAQAEDVLEADEMWSFVHNRSNKRWLWTVICRRTRQIVAFVIGDRSEAICRKLWEQIPSTYRRCRSFSDFWDAYQAVFPAGTHERVYYPVETDTPELLSPVLRREPNMIFAHPLRMCYTPCRFGSLNSAILLE